MTIRDVIIDKIQAVAQKTGHTQAEVAGRVLHFLNELDWAATQGAETERNQGVRAPGGEG